MNNARLRLQFVSQPKRAILFGARRKDPAQSRQLGFVPVPTTTRLFTSTAIAPLLPQLSSFHLTRGDCDGPLAYEQANEGSTSQSDDARR